MAERREVVVTTKNVGTVRMEKIEGPDSHRYITLNVDGVTSEQLERLHEYIDGNPEFREPINRVEEIGDGKAAVRRIVLRDAVTLRAQIKRGPRNRFMVDIRILAEAIYASNAATGYGYRKRPPIVWLQHILNTLDLFPVEPRDEQVPV